jgi:Na+-transporting NADH:ubiquinone oxidoreductase subunit F
MVFLSPILAFVGILVGLAVVLVVAERVLVRYGVCKIDINEGQRELEVQGGQTLLSALNAEQIFIPSACGGRGSCGYCKVTVLAGGGTVLPTETPLLTRQEIRRGVRLACQVKLREDIRIEIPEELLEVRLFTAKVESTRYLTHDIKEIKVALIDPPEIPHHPGQYVQVQVPSVGEPVFRAYSISSPAYEPNVVELVVRLVPGGLGSTYLHNVRVGDTITFTGPFGEFRLSEDPEKEVACVGGGCGLAPMKNIVYSLYRRWPDRSCWLFFGCRTTEDVFYLEEFEEMARRHPSFRVVYALSEPRPGEEWRGERGFIHLAVDKYLKPGVNRQAFLCGPAPMIEAVTEVLKEKGLQPRDIYYDKF